MNNKKVVDFFSVHNREEVAEIDKRIGKQQKEYDAKLRDRMMKAKDFPMTD
jgi:very-short-patch-repair endonuclease